MPYFFWRRWTAGVAQLVGQIVRSITQVRYLVVPPRVRALILERTVSLMVTRRRILSLDRRLVALVLPKKIRLIRLDTPNTL